MAGLQAREGRDDRARQSRSRRPAREGRRAHRRADADEPVDTLGLFDESIEEVAEIFHARGALALLRRREPERRRRQVAAGRHGLRRHPLQPAQDVLAAARRRRSRALGRSRCAQMLEPFLPGAAASCVTAMRSARPTTVRSRSAACAASAAPSASSSARTPTCAPTAPTACGDVGDGGAERELRARPRSRTTTRSPYDRLCMHEFVLSARKLEEGVRDHARSTSRSG